jgi:two-component system NarL family sensor kinase
LLSNIYEATGRIGEAFDIHKKYSILKDSLLNIEKIEVVKHLETKYLTIQKDKEIAEKQLQIAKQEVKIRNRSLWLYVTVSVAILLGIIFINMFRIFKHKHKLKNRQMLIMQQQHEIEQLKAIMEGEEKERSRLARELHDGIGGMLASIRMNLGAAKDDYKHQVDTRHLDELIYLVQDTSTEVRKTAHNLMPDVLTKHSLVEALIIYCDTISKGKELEIDIQFRGNLHSLDKATELMLYRMVQEMIQNIIKHAQAKNAAIQLIEEEGRIIIFVEDDGIGFDVNNTKGGYGLQNLHHRVRALNGEISIMSEPGRGTTVHIAFEVKGEK